MHRLGRVPRLPPGPGGAGAIRGGRRLTVPQSRRKLEDTTMDAKGFVVLPGEAPVLAMATPGRSAALMLQSEATAESVMMFQETVPVGTAGGPYHLHHASHDVIYVLSGGITCKIGGRGAGGGARASASSPPWPPHAWKDTAGENPRAPFIYIPARG